MPLHQVQIIDMADERRVRVAGEARQLHGDAAGQGNQLLGRSFRRADARYLRHVGGRPCASATNEVTGNVTGACRIGA